MAEELNTQQDQEELESFVLEKTDFKKRLKSASAATKYFDEGLAKSDFKRQYLDFIFDKVLGDVKGGRPNL
ncbi:hypothetical protein [Phaeodactylibacter sp.]|uniref:hypothetical protein n=1 Tax=Phaeodactylibacter sp. TaxID=1940289 RepID=UPI0025EB4CDC|nr:hypothetical protein [Phaeodactylibacter sp.]MCI5090844.1 hypothetical protein [Phaeodactylibacter sp.]